MCSTGEFAVYRGTPPSKLCPHEYQRRCSGGGDGAGVEPRAVSKALKRCDKLWTSKQQVIARVRGSFKLRRARVKTANRYVLTVTGAATAGEGMECFQVHAASENGQLLAAIWCSSGANQQQLERQ